MTDRWALYVDVEGFGSKWNETTMEAFRGINTLMDAIFRIGSRCYPEPPSRVFAHQFGDAFLIISDFHEAMLDRAALVGIALLRQLLSVDEVAKCSMDEGDISDVANCYPQSIRKQYNGGHIGIGAGLMTVTPVMGTALIRTSVIQKRVHGPLFIMRKELAYRISDGFLIDDLADTDFVSLNWLRGEPPGLTELQSSAGLSRCDEGQRLDQLESYLERSSGVSDAWRKNARACLLASAAEFGR